MKMFSRLVGVSLLCLAAKTNAEPARPNIVLIMADDLGYECIGAYGGTSYKTPVLDALAQKGIRFNHCYAQPLCTPSRVKLLTGVSNIRNYEMFGYLNSSETTFANLLKEQGYATCIAGKWQLSGDADTIRSFGFDEHCVWNMLPYHATEGKPKLKGPKNALNRYENPVLYRNGEWLSPGHGSYGPDICCAFAEDFIEKNCKKPFLVYYPMILTHSPFDPTPDSDDWKKSCEGSKKHKNKTVYFKDMVAYADKLVGRITKKLDQLGLRENTLVIFIGDNGTDTHITSFMGPRRVAGGKGLMTNAGTHVPLIVSWPQTAAPGDICDDPVDFRDFLPTLCDVSGVTLPQNITLNGQSFLPQIKGKKGKNRDGIFCYYNPRPKRNGPKGRRFARDQRWKLYGSGELYDIKNDVLEKTPIPVGNANKKAADARKKLQGVINSMPAKPLRIK